MGEGISVNRSQFERVAQIIAADRQDLVDLCLELGNTPSPHAQERTVAAKCVDWLRQSGMEAFLQPITDRSANAVGILRGTGGGRSLVCDAHIDTGDPLPDDAPDRVKKIHGAWVEDDLIYGYGVINCKAQVASFMMAARSLLRSGIPLAGDLIVAGVSHETGAPSVDDEQGIDCPGSGFGTKWLVDRGIFADYALVGETSNFGIVTAECGKLEVKITVKGREVYTPRLERGNSLAEHPNPFVKAAPLIAALEDWAIRFEQRARMEFARGVIIPKAQVERVRGGRGRAGLYFTVFLPPGTNPAEIVREIRQLTLDLGLDCDLSPYQWSRGYIAQRAEPLIDALEGAHQFVFGEPSVNPPSPVVSMWRDINVFNEVGIPSVCYGPARQREMYSDERDRAMRIDDLVAGCKVYAMTALTICG